MVHNRKKNGDIFWKIFLDAVAFCMSLQKEIIGDIFVNLLELVSHYELKHSKRKLR
jgi:hypothetical protein